MICNCDDPLLCKTGNSAFNRMANCFIIKFSCSNLITMILNSNTVPCVGSSSVYFRILLWGWVSEHQVSIFKGAKYKVKQETYETSSGLHTHTLWNGQSEKRNPLFHFRVNNLIDDLECALQNVKIRAYSFFINVQPHS